MRDKKRKIIRICTTAVGIWAVTTVALNLLNLLPGEKPYFPGPDSKYTAERLFKKGDCAGGYAIYEQRAARGSYDVGYLTIGGMKEEGYCGRPDIAGAIAAYRLAAKRGNCRANFELARIALLYPNVPNVKQIDYRDNLFAATICADATSDSKLISWYFDKTETKPVYPQLRKAFLEALARRAEFKKLPAKKRRAIKDRLVNGEGFDANSFGRY